MPKAKPATVTAKPAKAERREHDLDLKHARVLNRNRNGDSKTPVRVRVSREYTDRVSDLVSALAATYQGKAFTRDNLGAGSLGRAIYFGCVSYVSGADTVTSDADGDIWHGRNAKFKICNAKAPHAPSAKILADKR